MKYVTATKNLSSWSLRPWLVLAQTGAPFEEVLVALDKPDTREKLRTLTPAGKVPVLIDGDVTVWDSLAIVEYLAEKFPAAKLWPDDMKARAVARSLCAEMHSGFADLRKNMPMNVTGRKPGTGRNDAVDADIARICQLWRETRQKYGAGGDFLFGRFTIADAFFAPVVTRFVTYGVEVDATCKAYMNAVLALPAMQKWIAAASRE